MASRLIEGEAVLIVPSRREAHVLNETGSAAWALLDGTRTPGEIAGRLAERYDVAAPEAARDLDVFVQDLGARGALEVGESSYRSVAPDGGPPDPTNYAPPAVAETHPMEVLAAYCDSLRQGIPGGPGGGGGGKKPPKPGKCRADDTLCKKLFE